MIRVLVADDQELVRDGFAMIINAQEDMEVVSSVADGAAAVAQVRVHRPDVVLIDIRMPGMDGLEATRRILSAPDNVTRVLVLTTFDLDEYVYEALRSGASGFLLKDAPRTGLLAAVRSVAAGDTLLSPQVTTRLVERFVRRPARAPDGEVPERLRTLSARELEVLRLVARGLSNAEIAAELFVGEATVKSHVAHALGKLGLRDRVQAVVLAYESGFVEPEG